MATDTGTIHKEGNITVIDRTIRVFVAIVMLGYPMVTETSPLDVLALLPLIAIYPMFTAIVGWDPIQFAKETSELNEKTNLLSAVSRIVLVGVGVMMILATLTSPGNFVGWYSLLALFAIVPVMIAIMGENPIRALRESHGAITSNYEAYAEQSVIAKANSELVESAIEIMRDEKHKKAA